MQKFIIEKSEVGNIQSKDSIYDGICRENLCEWFDVAEFKDKETAISEFKRLYSDSEYLENYNSVIEYELVKIDYEIVDGDIEYGNEEIILQSHYNV